MMTISSGRVRLLVNALKTVALLTVFLTGCGKSGTTPQKTIPVTPVEYKDPAQYGTPFASVPDTKDVVMYEVNMQTYTPANFQGVAGRLDSIKALGGERDLADADLSHRGFKGGWFTLCG